MIGFQISVSGEPLYTVGVGEIGSIIAQMEWNNGKTHRGEILRDCMWVGVRAHSPMLGNHRHWQCKELKVGDEVVIKIVETAMPDSPLPLGTPPDYPQGGRGI